MKAFLMYRGQDFDLERKLPPHHEALTQDLELNALFNAMALGDPFLFEVASSAVLNGVGDDLDTILYRQDILKDCLQNASLVRDIYGTAVAAIEGQKKSSWTNGAKLRAFWDGFYEGVGERPGRSPTALFGSVHASRGVIVPAGGGWQWPAGKARLAVRTGPA
jgi:hypothetical protein